ncbi:MAG: hypothetical protein CL736_06860 [Chloroflexi bacterium]|nr:hypothetical protein [Chloroflexota bacterium]
MKFNFSLTHIISLILIVFFIIIVVYILAYGLSKSSGNTGAFGINETYNKIDLDNIPVTEFTVTELTGEKSKLDISSNGKSVTMVDFWNSWCQQCIQEVEELQQSYKNLSNKNIQFIGVAIWDDLGAIKSHIKEYEISYHNVIDEEGMVAIEFGVTGIPEKYFINSNGEIIMKILGPTTSEQLESVISEIILTNNSI